MKRDQQANARPALQLPRSIKLTPTGQILRKLAQLEKQLLSQLKRHLKKCNAKLVCYYLPSLNPTIWVKRGRDALAESLPSELLLEIPAYIQRRPVEFPRGTITKTATMFFGVPSEKNCLVIQCRTTQTAPPKMLIVVNDTSTHRRAATKLATSQDLKDSLEIFETEKRRLVDEFELQWRRDANRQLLKLESEFRKKITEVTAPKDIEPTVKQVIELLCDTMRLKQIAIFTPASHGSTFWTLLSHVGFDESLVHNSVYQRGEGLTGRTLDLELGGPGLVESLDIETDTRWSKNSGAGLRLSTLRVKSSNPNKKGKSRFSFVGVPIYSDKSRSLRPQGALVCVREAKGIATHFQAFELEFLRSISLLLSYVVDTADWHFEACLRETRQQQLTELMSSLRNQGEKYRIALEMLTKTGFFDRILLAKVDHEHLRIKGIASVGFDESLVLATDRVLFSNLAQLLPSDYEYSTRLPRSNKDDLREDILSVFARCFQKLSPKEPSNPLKIDPSHPLYESINVPTALNVGLAPCFVLVPLLDTNSVIRGIVLAECVSSEPLPAHIVSDVGLIATFVANTLRVDYLSERQTRVHSVLADGLQSLDRMSALNSRRSSALAVYERLIESICQQFEFSQGVLFVYDETNHQLTAVAGHRVNDGSLRDGVFVNIESSLSSATAVDSFIASVFRFGEWRFLWHTIDRMLSASVRHKLGLNGSDGCFGVPLTFGGATVGLILLVTPRFNVFRKRFASPELRPAIFLPEGLSQIAGFAGYILRSEREVVRRLEAESRVSSEHGALFSICQIADKLAKDETANLADVGETVQSLLSSVGRHAVNLLSANACGIMLSEKPVSIPVREDHSSGLRREFVPRGTRFRLVGGDGYRKEAFLPRMSDEKKEGLVYRYGERSVTMSVVQDLVPKVVQSLESDRLWSKGRRKFLDPGRFRNLKRSDRCWFGVPLYFTDGEMIHIFGVISVTRENKGALPSESDNRRELSALKRVADMLSLSLSTYVFRLGSLSRVRSWFEHDSKRIIQVLKEDLLEDLGSNSTSRQSFRVWQDHVSTFLDFLGSSIRVFSSNDGSSLALRSSRVSVKSLVDECRILSKVYQEPYCGIHITTQTPRETVQIDRERVVHIAINMIRNSCEAVARACVSGVSKVHSINMDMSLHADRIVIVVDDTGDGFSASEFKKVSEGGEVEKRGVRIIRHLLYQVDGIMLHDATKPDCVSTRLIVDIPVVKS